MKIEQEQRGKYLLILAKGRLDASWADYFTDALLLYIRNGQHHLLIDASELTFLSSAGIRALLLVFKELKTVRGSLLIVNSTPFVEQTLSTSGFDAWLSKNVPDDMPSSESGATDTPTENRGVKHFVLNEKARLNCVEPANWKPWEKVNEHAVKTLTFSEDIYAVGIGSSAASIEEARDQFGEFLAVSGNVVYQPPDEQGAPDFLVSEKKYVPCMQCIQALVCKGEMGHLIRFAPIEETLFYPVSQVLKMILDITKGEPAGFVILGEIEGLVGTSLIRSPGILKESLNVTFPEIRDWLSFCGERSYPHQQALLTGTAGLTAEFHQMNHLTVLPSCPEISAHIHGAVFPYQPMQNGRIELKAMVDKFFSGPPPLAVMHLADDTRPAVGLGESALIRGACWFSPIERAEVQS
jgi:anti-anti-sigma factor